MKTLKAGLILRIKEETYEIKKRYLSYLKKNNVVPLLITKENEQLLIDCDFVIFIGGSDIEPSRYNKNIYANFNKEDDEFEFHILDIATALHLPILGICRGIQLLNVYFGGTLKNISNHLNSFHFVTSLNEKIKIKKHQVNSYHHQAIDKLAENFSCLLISDDNIIEAIEDKKKRIIATQYHIEIDDPFNILNYFITSLLNNIN